MKKELKTTPYQKRANEAYEARHGLIQFNRRIKPEWKKSLEDLLKRFRKGKKV